MLSIHAEGQTYFSLNAGETVDFNPETASNLYTADSNHYYLLRPGNKGFVEFNTGEDAFIDVFNNDLNLTQSIRLRLNSTEKHKRLHPAKYYFDVLTDKNTYFYLYLILRKAKKRKSLNNAKKTT